MTTKVTTELIKPTSTVTRKLPTKTIMSPSANLLKIELSPDSPILSNKEEIRQNVTSNFRPMNLISKECDTDRFNQPSTRNKWGQEMPIPESVIKHAEKVIVSVHNSG